MARTRWAVGTARRLLTKHDVKDPPINVNELAAKLDVKIQHQDDFPDTLSAALMRSGDSAVVAVNGRHHEHRIRFSIAHELGHLLLHRDSGGYYDKRHQISVDLRNQTSVEGWNVKEIEANRFAAELLMPRRMVLAELEHIQIASELAKIFQVSEEAMTHRLANLRAS